MAARMTARPRAQPCNLHPNTLTPTTSHQHPHTNTSSPALIWPPVTPHSASAPNLAGGDDHRRGGVRHPDDPQNLQGRVQGHTRSAPELHRRPRRRAAR
eukprot:1870659-Prymnesium_polylepis.1